MADEKKVPGKTRAGGVAKPFPWEEAIGEQYERTKSRLKGLATDPEAELQRILEQYLPKKGDSREERLQKLEDLAMGFAGTTIGKVGNVRVKSTVKDPLRMAFPGIYQRPDVIAAEAASRVAPESPNLKAIFGVTRDDLYEMGKGRQGNLPGTLPGAAAKPRGSEAAARIMLPKNEQRIIDTLAEAEKYPELVRGMDPWYVMDPLFQRMEKLLGRERAIEEYTKFNTLMGMASPGTEVLTEIPRGTAAYYLQKQGRFPDFFEYAGVPAARRGANFPADIKNVPGHMYHTTSQALPMQRYLEAGEMQMDSPKVPLYIEASGVPEIGFQTATPVGDAHWSRSVGLADTRGKAMRKGKEVVPGASVTNPEMTMLAPWWRESIAEPLGLESVPAQARAWGTFSGQTGVTTPIGAPKLELIADKIAETARRLGVSLEKARDLVLTGEAYAGKKQGGAVGMAQGGLAQYGLRHSGEGVKGKGYFGPMAGREGTVTELSAEDESGEFPLVVPTLTAEELELLLAGKDPTIEMMEKASSWAATRRKRGESPFASPTEVRMPRPKAEGGPVNLTDLPDEVTPANWREHLQNNVLADARALLGVKDGGVINLDELIEKSLKKKDGGVINLDDLIDWTLAKSEHRKMKEGGAVKMQGGGNPGEVSGQMFKPKPLTIPEPITDLVEALRRQFEREKRSMRKPGAVQDVLMRGPVAAYAGAPADILGMGGELLDFVQKKIPALRKPASVMDTGPEKTPPMGYAPAFPLSPEGSYGTTAAQELMGKAGLTTGEERPLFEIGSAVAAPFATYGAFKAGKALAPTATDFLDLQLGNLMKPYQMSVVPEGGPKLSKEEYSRMMREKYAAQNLAKQEKAEVSLKPKEVKAPADDLGLYSPGEKAALNLKRNIGTGEAFLSDLRKAPDVGETDLLHTGLEDWLKSKNTVSKQEIQDYMNANRVRMRQRELSGEGVSEDMTFGRPETVDDYDYIQATADDYVYDWDNFGFKLRDEIREEILSKHSPEEADDLIASGKIDDLVEEEVGRLADQLAHDQYYDNPYRRWSNNAGYEIIGNDDVGYIVRSPNGDVVNRRDVYDFETAEGIAQSHGMDHGYGGAGSTQYSEYQLAGPSSNYREHLTQIDRAVQRSIRENELNDLARQMNQATDPIEKDRLLNEYNRLKEDVYEIYSGAHHDYEDIMSHSRTQDRVSDEGKNILHVDELQSDMHQDGAEFGYKTPELRQRYKTLMNERKALADEFGEARDRLQELTDAQTRASYRPGADMHNLPSQKEYEQAKARADQLAAKIDGLNKEMSDIEKAVPDAPFKKDWAEKEFKKLLTLAAKEDKDGITLSRWQDQLERWGTDSLAFRKTKTGEWVISGSKYRPLSKADLDDTITPKDVAEIMFAREGEYDCNSKEGLRDFVKRSLARGWSNAHIDRVTNKAWDQMQNLKPGEMAAIDPRKEGFKATYGKAYVEMMQKMARKYGGKMTTTKIDKGDGLIEVPYIEMSGNLLKSAKKGFPYKKGGAVSKADLEREYRMAFGGGVFNTDPDITDSGRIIPHNI